MDILDEEEEEINYFTSNGSRFLFGQGGPEDDPTNEFEIGQHIENKEEVIMVVKMYIIRRDVEYKILESDQLKYFVQCTQFV
ncbi:hypothetical protein Ahy_B08g092388 [Arachis hypogaea]|uniref:Transposase MuDR plant domain-containing protein n=1 Tax=Arachis hypogaea TaxID=3818 RepID=A0A444Y3M7_ARAHY|nr:hypothetical protein Ahy_B08g092388 [Arachis hypogaea]